MGSREATLGTWFSQACLQQMEGGCRGYTSAGAPAHWGVSWAGRLPHRPLSAPFLAASLDLQARVDAAASSAGAPADGAPAGAGGGGGAPGRAADGSCRQLQPFRDVGSGRHPVAWEQDELLQVGCASRLV